MNNSLENWINSNDLECEFRVNENIIICGGKIFNIIESNDVVLDKEFNLITECEDDWCDYHLFEFGDKWYYCREKESPEFNIFRYVGKCRSDLDLNIPYLGIHGGYEVCVGSGLYEDWVKKAQFLNISVLGICEYHTLAGVLAFQKACKNGGVKSIIGETLKVKVTENSFYQVKIYVRNEAGWRSLLRISAVVNVNNNGEYIDEKDLLNFADKENLICVISCDTQLSFLLINKLSNHFQSLYYQLDFVEWSNDAKDLEWLNNINSYLLNYRNKIKCCLICDSYYLEESESENKILLNKIGKVGFSNQSKKQYFKSLNSILEEMGELFQDTNALMELFGEMVENTYNLCDNIDFSIPTKQFHLPQYIMTQEESQSFTSLEDLFMVLIEEGLSEKIIGKVENEEIYVERVLKEVEVINEGGFISYFLITKDMIDFCKRENILVGIGRGSVGGSLVAYLLNITMIDPLKYDLLFERFLNAGRLKSGLPDIDTDIEGSRRDDVKKYLEGRWGENNVASIGTFSTFKARAVIKDLGREIGLPNQTVNYYTSMIEPESTFTDIFKQASSIPRLKDFIQNNYRLFNKINQIQFQPRSTSIHAAGFIITPKIFNGEERNIWEWVPVKKIGGLLVTEWEGEWVEEAGFLKQDILGIRQLEKFKSIIRLIKEKRGIEIILKDIPLDEGGVYSLFQKGYNEDVFQFGAKGLKGYCQDLMPDCFEDLVATVALYRPGSININAHDDYAKIKNGYKFPIFDKGLEEITKDTFGLLIYQEQIMQVCQKIAGFSLDEADDIRKAIGKKNQAVMDGYKVGFLEGAEKNGYEVKWSKGLWDKIEKFAQYSFNKSHSVAYAMTGYFSQWFKYKYPLEFWLTALQYADAEDLANRVVEIKKISSIKIEPVNINKSNILFEAEKDTIYWSINAVKWVGEKAVENIIEERKNGGEFYSLKEFHDRVNKTVVNRRVIENLILVGAFDEIEHVWMITDRGRLINSLKDLYKKKKEEEKVVYETWKSWEWEIKQKELCGMGYIDFEAIFKNSKLKNLYEYLDVQSFFTEKYLGKERCIAGLIKSIRERESRNGKFAEIILDCNDEEVVVVMWSGKWPENKANIKVNKLLIIGGEVKFDGYKKHNVLQTNTKTKLQIL